MSAKNKIEKLASDFESCQKILCAIGDEKRQHLIVEMMKMGKCSGVRVGEITEKTHLSRPAVSHHLQILKEAGILKIRREGTMNFYYFDPDMDSFEKLIGVLQKAIEIASELPDRSNMLRLTLTTYCVLCIMCYKGDERKKIPKDIHIIGKELKIFNIM